MPITLDDPFANVALQGREHLIRFLMGSHRRFWVMDARDFVESLPNPFKENMEVVQQLVTSYRDHRRVISSGYSEDLTVEDPLSGRTKEVAVSIMKGEPLEPEELDLLIEWAAEEKQLALSRRLAGKKNVKAE